MIKIRSKGLFSEFRKWVHDTAAEKELTLNHFAQLGLFKAWGLVLWASKISQKNLCSFYERLQQHESHTNPGRVWKSWLSSLSTWVLTHLHTSRWIPQNSHSAGYSGRGLGAKWVNPDPEGCCRRSAALFHWCSHWRDCRSCRLFLRKEEEASLVVLWEIRQFQLCADVLQSVPRQL